MSDRTHPAEVIQRHLRELGQNPDNLDVDIEQDTYTVDELNAVMDALREGVMARIEPELANDQIQTDDGGLINVRHISGYDTDYYGGHFMDTDRMFDPLQFVQTHGAEPQNHRSAVPQYSTDGERMRATSLSAEDVRHHALMHFFDFVEDNISEKRAGKFRFLEHLHEHHDNLDTDWLMEWFDAPDEVDFDEFNANAFRDDPGFEMRKPEKAYNEVINHDWPEIRSTWAINDYDAVYDAAVADVAHTMQGLTQAVPTEEREGFKAKADGYRRFFEKFNPLLYAELSASEHEYDVVTAAEPAKMHRAAQVVSSCLRHDGYRHAFDDWADDPGTFYQVIGKDGRVQGYTRSFLMRDEDEKLFLGLDTIEVPKTNGENDLDVLREDFEARRDVMKAGTLGVIHLMNDLGVDYVAGREGRINFGQRQAYGNTRKTLTFEKLGDEVGYYATKQDGETEIRGFPTEPGTHTHEAYILAENPARF